MRWINIILIVLFFIFLVTFSTFAKEKPVSSEELLRTSDLILLGKITKTESSWNVEKTQICTNVTIAIETYIKSDRTDDVITFQITGGKVGDITEVVSDLPSFSVGERLVLFFQQEADKLILAPGDAKVQILDNRVAGSNTVVYDYVYELQQIAERQGFKPASTGRMGNNFPRPESINMPAMQKLIQATSGKNIPVLHTVRPPTLAAWSTIMSENFEGSWPASGWGRFWNTTPADPGYGYTWDKDDFKPANGAYSAWGAASNQTGQPDLDPATSNYPNSMDGWMYYGPFSLVDANLAKLDFFFWLLSQSGDIFSWYASINGSNWYGYGVSGSTGGWYQQNFDLTAVPTLGNLCGQGSVWIAFRFQSNTSTNDKGAFVDDINLANYTGLVPTITSISPPEASAGTGTNITITGSNFGATQGAGKVEFFYRSGQPMISAPIVSWSNTSIVCTPPIATVNGYPASAGSGPVRVTNNDGGYSSGYNFIITFGKGGAYWLGPHPVVDYYINANTNDCDGEDWALINAAWEWINTNANFGFHVAGTHSSTVASLNNKNELMWGTTSGSLATSTYWSVGSIMLEVDIVFNDNYLWGIGTGAFYDIQSIATHEFGHWLTLRDLYGNIGDSENDVAKTMYGFGSTNDIGPRSLHADDIAGIYNIYGNSTNAIPSISLVLPGAGNVNVPKGQLFSITWTDSDADNNATISLAYDSDGKYWNGGSTFITTSLTEDPDGSGDIYTWDTSSMLLGSYYIWARITDGINPNRYSVSLGTITITAPQSMNISLQSGWNMISSYITPANPAVQTIMSGLGAGLIIMKNNLGQVYWPALSIDQIGNWRIDHGYNVYMQAAATLTMTGTEVDPSVSPISLAIGWNLTSYLRNNAMDVAIALAGISSQLVITKNGAGQVYWPALGINTIGTLQPGQGYQIYVNQATTLIYPANGSFLKDSDLIVQALPSPNHYKGYRTSTGDNAVLLVTTQELLDGTEIGAWTATHLLVGSGVVHQGKALLTLWGDDTATEEVDGAVAGDLISISCWQPDQNSEYTLDCVNLTDELTNVSLPPSLIYQSNAVWLASTSAAAAMPTEYKLSQNYPNPFNPTTTIKYQLPQGAEVEIKVFNVAGSMVRTLVRTKKNAGFHEIIWDGRDDREIPVSSGIYWVKMKAGGFEKTFKMTLIR